MTLLSAWLMFVGVLFLANAWLRPTLSPKQSWLARYRPFAWLEEVGLNGTRTQARLQRMRGYRTAMTAGGALFVGAGIVGVLTQLS